MPQQMLQEGDEVGGEVPDCNVKTAHGDEEANELLTAGWELYAALGSITMASRISACLDRMQASWWCSMRNFRRRGLIRGGSGSLRAG